jgi:hypothetical protein
MHRPKRRQRTISGSKNGKLPSVKPQPGTLLRYEELLRKMKAQNLPPMDITAVEKRVRALEGF